MVYILGTMSGLSAVGLALEGDHDEHRVKPSRYNWHFDGYGAHDVQRHYRGVGASYLCCPGEHGVYICCPCGPDILNRSTIIQSGLVLSRRSYTSEQQI